MTATQVSPPAVLRSRPLSAGQVRRFALTAVIALCGLALMSAAAFATTGYQLSGQFETTGLNPEALAIDQSTNSLYAAEAFGPGVVERFAEGGASLDTFGAGEGTSFTGVAVDPLDNDVYAYDSSHQLIDAFGPSGEPVDVFDAGTASTLPVNGGEFAAAQIASDSTGDIYYPNQALGEVQELQPDGLPGTVTITGLSTPTDVAVSTSGAIYVVDTDPTGVTQVQQFDAAGSPTGVLGAGILSGPRAVTTDSSGDVFVLDGSGEAATVDELTASGGFVRAFASGLIAGATGIAVDSTSKTVYVAISRFSHGPILSFTPSSVTAPTAVTGAATAGAQGEEEVTGTVDPAGTETTFEFEYGTTGGYGRSAPLPSGEAGLATTEVSVAAMLSELEPGRTYDYRVLATNAEGDRAYGANQSFTTPALSPSVTGEAATSITQTDATLEAQINPNNQASTYYFRYGTSPTLTDATAVPMPPDPEAGAGFGEQPVSQDLGETLLPNTTYYYRVIATNPTGMSEGAIESFTTLPLAPLADAETASSITQTTAVLNGMLTTQDAPSDYRFQYVDDTSFQSTGWYTAVSAPVSETGAEASLQPTAVAASIAGLQPDTVYHVRLIATNAGGMTEGVSNTFTTSAARPVLDTGLPIAIQSTAATVQGGVNTGGAETAVEFQYGPTLAYGKLTPEVDVAAGGEAQPVLAALTGLAPGTTYHYRLLATNSSGSAEGADASFTTPAEAGSSGGTIASPFGTGTSVAPPLITYGDLSGETPMPPPGPTPATAPPKASSKSDSLARALRVCKKEKSGEKRRKCEKKARGRYGTASKKR
jgi:hypothetical protein